MQIPNEILIPMVASDLRRGVDVVMSTKGNSMLPFIFEGDSVTLRRQDVSVGDIVLAKVSSGNFVMHRVKEIHADKIVLKGDGNLCGVEHCTAEDVAGTVIDIRRSRSPRVLVCSDKKFVRRSRLWNRLPRIIRRYSLGVLRRVIK